MILSGMCFDCPKADSFFSYVDSRENQNIYRLSKSVLVNQDLCTEDLIGERTSGSTYTQESRSGSKLNSKLRIVLSLLEIPPENPAYIAEAAGVNVVSNTTYSSLAVIDYIHRQDGKKS